MYKCRLCESKELSEIFQLGNCLIDGIYIEEAQTIKIPKEEFTLLKCNNCGLIQLKEIVDQEAIYSNYKFSSTNTKYILYWMDFLANTLINIFETRNKKILEIGASDGYFLNLFKENNKVKGIEPSRILINSAKEKYNLDIDHGYFGKGSYKGEKFDLILCRHVLEHIETLRTFIDNMNEIIQKDGRIYIEIPDIEIILNNLNYSNFFHEHINYFSKEVIIKYFQELGYKTILLIDNNVHNGSFGILLERQAVNNKFLDIQKKINEDKLTFNNILKGKPYKNISGYGAANKTFKLISIFDLEKVISCIYDINESLNNKYLPTEPAIIIKKSIEIINDNPDCIIVFATSYTDEIIKYLKEELGYSGDIIGLFPEVKIY